jgi:type I restriction enzyme, S subunit
LSGKGKGWETVILEELGDFTKGMGITKVELVEQGIPCIRYGEIYTVHHFVVSKFYSFISKETAEQSRKIAKNDILFAGSGETLEDIGKAVVFIGNEEVYAGGDIIIFSPTNIYVDSIYLSYLLNSEFVRKQIRTFGQGQSVVHLYTRDISKIKILLPSLEEQTTIAKILNTADAEIQATKAYLKTLKQQKKGLMQQLLTGRIIVKTK